MELTIPQAERVLDALGFTMAGEGPDTWTATDWRVAERAQATISAALDEAAT